MADVSDEGIRKSLGKLVSDRDPTNWFSITYSEGSTDKLVLCGVGTGGLPELARSLSPTFQGYAFLRVQNKPSTPKYVLVQFVGKDCTALQKARVIVHEEDILSVLKPVNAQIAAASADDLTEDKITEALLKGK